MTRNFAARVLSVLGHPALLMPGAVVLAGLNKSAAPNVLIAAAAVSVIVSVIVVGYSWRQVRSGNWSHFDASVLGERSQLNVFLAFIFFSAAALMLWVGMPPAVITGLVVAGVLVVFAQLMRRWFKVSLHVSFAVFAASLLWPSVFGTTLILCVAIGVTWSRLELQRHTPQEVALGLFAGATGGIFFNNIIAA